MIPFCDVCQIGSDIILVSFKEKEKEKPDKRSADEQGVINQAKSLLIEKNGMTEEEAHRYLQKRSMDNGTNMVETSYMVLQVFDLK